MNELGLRLGSALINRYEIQDEIGRGGMAVVFLGRDLKHDRRVAIKMLRPEFGASLIADRFLREIQIAAQLQHPLIVPLLDSGADDGLLWYAMPFVQGETLRRRLDREKQLPVDVTVGIAREVAEALSHAHAQGFVHRDIKPENILLSRGHGLVADFGIARAVAAAGGAQMTSAGVAIGTPAYMSPEQGAGDVDLDIRSDIYSLGCVFYEMLAGEPPFTGPTPQAVIARHMQERIPSVSVVRPSVPRDLQEVIERCLAKVATDRFAGAAEMIAALDRAATSHERLPGFWEMKVRWRVGIGVALLSFAATVIMERLPDWTGPLDPNKVVVFPLIDERADEREAGSGERIALLIGSALEQSDPLRWIYGWTWLDATQRENPRILSAKEARRITRHRRARYFVDGWTVQQDDSATVILRLHDAAGDSLVAQVSAAGVAGDATLTQLGLRAVTLLLPNLVAPGRRVDLSVLAGRTPAAVSHWLHGERSHRRSQFAPALEHFRLALAEDSGLVFAALKGALAASWLDRSAEGLSLVETALRQREKLPESQVRFADGLRAYLSGRSDDAVGHFAAAVRLNPEWSDAWMLLGEVYYHLLPLETLDTLAARRPDLLTLSADSLARAAFTEARQFDRDYTPALVHLAEIALLNGDARHAAALVAEFARVGPDTTEARQLRLMLECVRNGSRRIQWAENARSNPRAVLWAAKSLSAGGRHLECVEGGFGAVLGAQEASAAQRWNALLGLHHWRAAHGRWDEAEVLVDSAAAAGTLPARALLVLDNVVYEVFEERAKEVVERFGRNYDTLQTWPLWLLGTWHVSRGDAHEVNTIAAVLDRRAGRTRDRLDRLVADVLQAHRALLEHDSLAALHLFRGLVPTATRSSIAWSMWEPLAYERLTLARLLAARGDLVESYRVASEFDFPQAVMFLLYLPQSLALRHDVAKRLHRPDLAASVRRRLVQLGRDDLLDPRPSLTLSRGDDSWAHRGMR